MDKWGRMPFCLIRERPIMDESSVLELLEDLSILLEDAKPVFGKNNLRQVDVGEALDIIDEIQIGRASCRERV